MSSCYLSNGSLIKLSSFVVWGWIYFTTVDCADRKGPEGPEWCSRVLALLHATVAIVVGSKQCKWRTLTPYYLPKRILPCQYLLMVWSWGYFAFDLLWCLIYWSHDRLILCHHAIALFAITRYMQKDHTGCTFACTLLVLEMTNPLLQTRWFLKSAGNGNSKFYYTVEFLYLALFLFLRGVLGTLAMYWVLTTDYFDLEDKLITTVFYVVSLIFIYDITCYIRYKYKREIKLMQRDFFYATQIITEAEKRQLLLDNETQTPARCPLSYYCSML